MMGSQSIRIGREGWCIEAYDGAGEIGSELRDKLIERATAAIAGQLRRPVRRSRHAVTYRSRIPAGDGQSQIVFIKLFDRPRGADMVSRILRGSRAHIARRAAQLVKAAGFRVPVVLMVGEEGVAGRALLMTERIDGEPITRFVQACDFATRRAVMRQLGREVGRLHRAGFLHGDLTPFNIFISPEEPPDFVFIDHERTRRAPPIGRRRHQLRNLVQLGRFDIEAVSPTDRMRVFHGWADELGVRRRRAAMRRTLRMLAARIVRDGVRVRVGGKGEVTARRASNG